MSQSIENKLSSREKDSLCEKCEKLILTRKQRLNRSRDPIVSLGKYRDVRQRERCPFCRLVSWTPPGTELIRNFNEDDEINMRFMDGDESYVIEAGGFGSNYVFFEGHAWPPIENYVRARKLDSTSIDMTRIRRWLKLCEDLHAECAAGPPADVEHRHPSKSRSLRVIDVCDMCIVEVPYTCRYLTLSYVWGSVETIRLLKSNIKRLMAHGGLRDVQEDLPRTIRDAIDLVDKIGERYLWVDSLCLVKDDQKDLMNGIQEMDLIYEQSVLTIVAATGLDANAGLPGVWRNSRQVNQYVEDVLPDVKLTCQYEPAAYMKVSKYATRGWTYQEQYLAKRSLVFINQQVYFKCGQSVWAEDNTKDDSPLWSTHDMFDLMFLATNADEPPLSAYQISLQYYTARDLTIDDDAINAVSGFLKRLSRRMGCRLVEGLATAAFDANILFVPLTVADSTKTRRRCMFPSYSWAGWRGQQGWDTEDYNFEPDPASAIVGFHNHISLEDWLNKYTWIIWYERDSDGQVTPILAPNVVATSDKDIDYRHRVPADFPSLSHKPPLPTNPTRQISLRIRSTYPLLQFWTAVGYFSIHNQRLNDREMHHCGAIAFNDTSAFKNGQVAEFLVLSKCQLRTRRALGDDNLPNSARLANQKRLNLPWDLYWVMLVVWKDGVAERRALGQILQSALLQSYPPGPEWKEILLGIRPLQTLHLQPLLQNNISYGQLSLQQNPLLLLPELAQYWTQSSTET